MQRISITVLTSGDVKADPEAVCAAVRTFINQGHAAKQVGSSTDGLIVSYEMYQNGGDGPLPSQGGAVVGMAAEQRFRRE